MALVLRKALLPKNMSLFKPIKNRPLATTPKTNPATLSKAALWRSPKDEKVMLLGRRRFSRTKHLFESRSQRDGARSSLDVRFCASCPNFVPESRSKPYVPVRHFSLPRFRLIFKDPSYKKSSPVLLSIRSHLTDLTSKRPYSKCPPPPPPGPPGCACLPPPCNVPPRCIQFMTGYYYYPYGTWFCGPYHVSKGCCPVGPPCGPCCGPCGPCGPCCICPDCSAAPTYASTMVGAAPKVNQSGSFPGNHISYTPKEFVETKQQRKQPQQQSSQQQKSKHTFNKNSSINRDKPISSTGLKKVTPVVNATKFKNITTPRVVPPVMSSTYATTSGSRFNVFGRRWSSRYMSSDVEKPYFPTSPIDPPRPFNSTRPSFQTYVAQVPLSHLNSASTRISAQTYTKAKHPFKLPPECCSRGQSTVQDKGVTIAPYENPKIPSPPSPTEIEYYSSFKHYGHPASSVDWVFRKANEDKLCPKFK